MARAKAVKRAKALRKKEHLRKERRTARLSAAEKRAAKTRQRAAVAQLATARRIVASSEPRPSSGGSRGLPLVPVLVIAALVALLVLGLGFVSSTAVQRSRMFAVLEAHDGHFTLVGGIVLLCVAVVVALTLMT